MTDYGIFVLFLVGLMIGWFLLCGIIEMVSEKLRDRKAEKERAEKLEAEKKRLESEVKYLEYINRVTVLCRDFIK